MARKLLICIFLALPATCSLAAWAPPDCSFYMRPDGSERCQEMAQEGIYGTHRICASDLVPTPDWEGPETFEPPISDQTARDISRESLLEMGFELDEWKIFATELHALCTDRWYFMVVWHPRESHPGSFRVAINMDGQPLVNSHLPDGSDGEEGAAAHFERNKCLEGERARGLTGCFTPPELITKEPFRWPQELVDSGIGATVRLRFIIQQDGTVRDVRIVEADPAGFGLDEAGMRVAESLRYRPAHTRGEPFEYSSGYMFQLQGRN